MVSSETARRFLAGPALALVGASRSGRKFGNVALKTLRSKGYRVYPVHPGAESIDGERCYHDLASVPERVSAVIVVVPPHEAIGVVSDAHAAGMNQVWLQQGSESPAVLDACRDLGIEAVAGECVLMFAHPTSYHKAHAWLWRLLGKIPAGS
jgi:predicted CoA-binding protein